ncbi:LysR substrate-binding domain-containing protein, partial [Pseudomonas sp. B392_1p]|uniref:LysR substrate-binding domain-containing protein n=1 Tax=Pseudomonas sp. B392_1p TaxID=3457507 RepID=UPI003FCFC251
LSVHSDDADILVKRLGTGELDLAIDYLHFDDDELRYEPLREEELVVIASSNHPKIEGQLTLSQYQNSYHVSVHPR